MKKARLFFLSGIIWELLRLVVFLFILLLLFDKTLFSGTQVVLWILLIGSGQLIFPSAYFLLLIDRVKYSALLQILRIGKTLSIAVSFLIILNELLSTDIFLFLTGSQVYDRRYILAVFLGIFFDLIFLYFLLSYKGEEDHQKVDQSQTETRLPEFYETKVENTRNSNNEDQ